MLSAYFLTDLADKITPFMENLGTQVMDIYNGQFAVYTKSDASPFTTADTTTETKIIEFLQHHTPHIPVFAEESFYRESFDEESFDTVCRPIPDTFWLVDPIDGTKGFINRNNYFTINMGLIYNKQPVFGVVYEPQNKDIFIGFAWGDKQAFENIQKNPIFHINKTIKKSYNFDLLTYLSTDLSTGQDTPLWCSYKNHMRIQCGIMPDILTVATNADITKNPIKQFLSPHKVKKILAYTSSIKICMVATGQADLYPRYGKCYEWDTCAGDAILRGAGGVICDLQGIPLQYAKPNLINTAFICMGKQQ